MVPRLAVSLAHSHTQVSTVKIGVETKAGKGLLLPSIAVFRGALTPRWREEEEEAAAKRARNILCVCV